MIEYNPVDKTTVAGVWEHLRSKYKLEQVRIDRAVAEGSIHNMGPAVEVGYGSWTVRVRVFSGAILLGFVDLDSRQVMSDEKAQDISALMDQAGMVLK